MFQARIVFTCIVGCLRLQYLLDVVDKWEQYQCSHLVCEVYLLSSCICTSVSSQARWSQARRCYNPHQTAWHTDCCECSPMARARNGGLLVRDTGCGHKGGRCVCGEINLWINFKINIHRSISCQIRSLSAV